MDVFQLRDTVVNSYSDYVRSFVNVKDSKLAEFVEGHLNGETLWPEPLIQLNPAFESGGWIDDLASNSTLHQVCASVFRIKNLDHLHGESMRLHRHQVEAVQTARQRENYVLTTGTGSGKSLAYILPIVDHVLRNGSGNGVQAIVVYPMNALCNSQYGELEKFLRLGFPAGKEPVRFASYTGQTSQEEREEIRRNPPDIILTNYVMLELLLTRPTDTKLVAASQNLSFLVLDELHTYRGRQGADVALLVRRLREACNAPDVLCVGTSATMATGGSRVDRNKKVAEVASQLFGSVVKPENVIGETLRRQTNVFDDVTDLDRLRKDIACKEIPGTYLEFSSSAMAGWLESNFGLTNEDDGSLVRQVPLPINGENGATRRLAELSGLDETICERAIRNWLLAGYECEPDPDSRLRPFAFRLHQFISRGDTVYASLEDDDSRRHSLNGQQFAPDDPDTVLLPLCFCRECGATYYAAWRFERNGRVCFRSRDLYDRADDPDRGEAGFLFRDPQNPWPEEEGEVVFRLPDDWLEEASGRLRIRKGLKASEPQSLPINTAGEVDAGGLEFQWIPTPFRFCLSCSVSYRVRKGASDFAQLATLASGGRSSATTVLGLSAVQYLKKEGTLQEHARKLLSFTDNRQDASLQAGHFNDFVEVSLLRSGLYKAIVAAGEEGLAHDELAQKTFRALSLGLDDYAAQPGVQFAQKTQTEKALRNVLAYRLYCDLRRGWRISSPNLEQCGLLRIEYPSLDELCASDQMWQGTHAALVISSPATRLNICTTLLDFMRRELAINVEYLANEFFERLQQQSGQNLRQPWALDEQEKPYTASVVFPRSRQHGERLYNTYISSRSGFGLYIGRRGTLPEFEASGGKLKTDDKSEVLVDLFKVLASAGYLEIAEDPKDPDQPPGYQLQASAISWHAANGDVAFHDPIRVPNPPEGGSKTNSFFVEFYKTVAGSLKGLEAKEHTAQVPYSERQDRERDFGSAKLPVLFCSPTMELGVDIRQLNVVNMRNVPPTPANYAQRSGRAGRSGQPALVYTYCTTGSSHDQYFFRRQTLMVSGSVKPPRLDLANEDLIQAHMQAVWLAETKQALGDSLTDLLECEGERPSLQIRDSVKSGLTQPGVIRRALQKGSSILSTLQSDLASADWYSENWLEQILNHTLHEFDRACDRWRSLFNAATAQLEHQNRIISDVAQRHRWEEAKRISKEAQAQRELLTESGNLSHSDFYSYRYFASEGFLPGYNFPRLPLSAYIPARRRSRGQDEFLSRPRFLAITEFGPNSLIYHEGSRYVVNKVILPPGEREAMTTSAKVCLSCGYVRELNSAEAGPDLCENCNSIALQRIAPLLRLQNVSTRRRDRINSDEEERTRLGYEVRTGLRFKEISGQPQFQSAEVIHSSEKKLNLQYGSAATIWRINLGWKRRKNKEQHGFVLDLEKGYWQKSDELPDDDDVTDPLGPRTNRVVPFVEDRRNCLVLSPESTLLPGDMASFQAAVKKAIEAVYQLEDNELAAEPLPSSTDPRQLLFYEAAEGGAGVLRRILDDGLNEVAREALQICHFDPDTGIDLKRADGANEDCSRACYDCLMSYGNQRDHEFLNRQAVKDLLMELASSKTEASQAPVTLASHLENLKSMCDSELEKRWLDYLVERDLKLPTTAQKYYKKCSTKPDFVYETDHTAIYIDGPPHDFPDRQKRDDEKTMAMQDFGITVLRFHHTDDWAEQISRFPHIFGISRESTMQPLNPSVVDAHDEEHNLDLDLFDDDWHTIITSLSQNDGELQIESGEDVYDSRRVVGMYELKLTTANGELIVIDSRDEAAQLISDVLKKQQRPCIAVDPNEANASTVILKAAGLGS